MEILNKTDFNNICTAYVKCFYIVNQLYLLDR